MAGSGPTPGGGALVSRPNAPRGSSPDARLRDYRTRAQIFRDRLGPPAVLQDRTDRGRGRRRFQATATALDGALREPLAYFLFTPWSRFRRLRRGSLRSGSGPSWPGACRTLADCNALRQPEIDPVGWAPVP